MIITAQSAVWAKLALIAFILKSHPVLFCSLSLLPSNSLKMLPFSRCPHLKHCRDTRPCATSFSELCLTFAVSSTGKILQLSPPEGAPLRGVMWGWSPGRLIRTLPEGCCWTLPMTSRRPAEQFHYPGDFLMVIVGIFHMLLSRSDYEPFISKDYLHSFLKTVIWPHLLGSLFLDETRVYSDDQLSRCFYMLLTASFHCSFSLPVRLVKINDSDFL